MKDWWPDFEPIGDEWELSAQQRRKIKRSALKTFYDHLPIKTIFGITLLVLVPVIGGETFGIPRWLHLALMSLVGTAAVMVMVFFFLRYWKRYYLSSLWKEMRNSGLNICTHCGHWLRGLDEDVQRCPECGVSVRRRRV